MPAVDQYGTQPALELLRQHLDYGAFYDRAKLDQKKEIKDVQFLASMNPTVGSFTIIPRLMRHFATFACAFPSQSDVKTMYQTVLESHFCRNAGWSDRIRLFSSLIVDATADLLKEVAARFLPTATKFHYQFNLREMSSVMQGLHLFQLRSRSLLVHCLIFPLGLCMTDPPHFNDQPHKLCALWQVWIVFVISFLLPFSFSLPLYFIVSSFLV